MSSIKPCSKKSHSELVEEWDQLASERHRQIESGQDISFNHVVVPAMLKLCKGIDKSFALDIGSGTGEFTSRLAEIAKHIVGIDPSTKSISIAKLNCQNNKNVQFVNLPLESVGDLLGNKSITVALACMVLMATPDLSAFTKSLSRLLRDNARFIAIFTHPCYWSRYWNYEAESWFNYNREVFIEAPFKISKHMTGIRTTHVHRPLEMYFNEFNNAGFLLEKIAEPMPSPKVSKEYPEPWQFPRFFAARWRKVV